MSMIEPTADQFLNFFALFSSLIELKEEKRSVTEKNEEEMNMPTFFFQSENSS